VKIVRPTWNIHSPGDFCGKDFCGYKQFLAETIYHNENLKHYEKLFFDVAPTAMETLEKDRRTPLKKP